MVDKTLPASDPREVLQRLCAERGVDYASLSRLVGRNPAYIQQFIRRGTPRRLPEQERRLIARHLEVPEHWLGGEAGVAASAHLVAVPLLDLGASAGGGAVAGEEVAAAVMAFDPAWLRRLTQAGADELGILRVEGDSMIPTLHPGDDILVDRSDAAERMRDGLYLLRVEELLLVKRLTLHPVKRRVTVQSDNPAYADWPDLPLDEVVPVGRVIWAGRRVA
jgi:phage repressor protein C with HTH and peptisase S24 domain